MESEKREMSNEHKAALAVGRTESRAVKNYLEAVANNRPKRGRKRTPESINARLAKIDQSIGATDPLSALNMRQERIDLQAEIASMSESDNIEELEAEFVKSAKGYGERKGISYSVWRDSGVSAEVLTKAGIGRSRS